MRDRKHNFHEGAGNPILGYGLDDGTVCRDCAKDDPELATVNPKDVEPITLRDVGEGTGAYPDGFTCAGCGDTIGSWDYNGDR